MTLLARSGLLVALVAVSVVAAPVRKSPPGAHPIVQASDGYLLGGVVNGKWIDAAGMAPHVKGGERYRVCSLTRFLQISVGSRTRLEDPGPTHFIDLNPASRAEPEAFAICGNWQPLPRKPVSQTPKQKVYEDAVRAVLKQKGLAGAKVNVTQVLRVDLEGDGKQEVLVSATTPRTGYPQPGSQKNDYSLVLLRKIAGGTLKTFVLDGEFYPKAVRFNAPDAFKVAAVLDFDGDGVMEIAVSSRYYEGGGVAIYTIRNGKVVRLLSGGSGA